MSTFVRKVLLTLEKLQKLEYEISEVSIAFVDDEAMKDLNHKFRRTNRTTDVLTFPADDSYADPSVSGRPLGDIVISVDQARRQAAGEKHSLPTEVRYLILHGVLHALGYDHETDNGEMSALELEVRRGVGLD
jgi:probable rRNA maturation factor